MLIKPHDLQIILEDIPAKINAVLSGEGLRPFSAFQSAEKVLSQMLPIIEKFRSVQFESLPDGMVNAMVAPFREVTSSLDKLEPMARSGMTYSSTQAQMAEGILNALVQQGNALINAAAQWAGLLMMNELPAQQIRDKMAEMISELTEIRAQARERMGAIAADVSVAAHSKHFSDAANQASRNADKWLDTTKYIAISTLVMGIISFLYSAFELLPNVQTEVIATHLALITSKIFILSVGFTASVWCGKMYKSIKHQEALLRHKALSIDTFLSFVETAGEDADSRRAILLETTRAIFSTPSTGLVSDGDRDCELKVIEIIRSMGVGPGKSI